MIQINTAAGRTQIKGKLGAIIKAQPGYSEFDSTGKPQDRVVARTKTGGVRLYVRPAPSHPYMDASLADVPELESLVSL